MIIILYVYISYISYLVCLVSTIPKFLLMKSPDFILIVVVMMIVMILWIIIIIIIMVPILLLGIPISSIWERVLNLNESSRRSENINGGDDHEY